MLDWIYDIPTFELGIGTITIFACLSAAGLALTRRWIYRRFSLSESSNETINGFFAGVGVIYGLLVGLVAVASWDNFKNVDDISSRESSAIAALYQDISTLDQPAKGQLQGYLEQYLRYVIEVAWPGHQRGESPRGGGKMLSSFHAVLATYHPLSLEQEILQREALSAFNRLIEARSLRLASIDSGIPGVFWVALLGGTLATILIAYFFHLSSAALHIGLVSVFGGFVGCLIFLIFAIDQPFRGQLSVQPDAYLHLHAILEDLDPGLNPPAPLERNLGLRKGPAQGMEPGK